MHILYENYVCDSHIFNRWQRKAKMCHRHCVTMSNFLSQIIHFMRTFEYIYMIKRHYAFLRRNLPCEKKKQTASLCVCMCALNSSQTMIAVLRLSHRDHCSFSDPFDKEHYYNNNNSMNNNNDIKSSILLR